MGQYVGLFDKELHRAHTLSNAIFYTSIFIIQLKQHRLLLKYLIVLCVFSNIQDVPQPIWDCIMQTISILEIAKFLDRNNLERHKINKFQKRTK